MDPKHAQPDHPDDLDSEEIVNDSLGEETPADSTGLDEEDDVPNRKHPA